jgi:hypothetical protein
LVYLDHSTLVNAFDGKRGEGAAPEINADLASVIEDVAGRGTLCISIHVFEMARRDDAVAMATWIGGLSPLWLQTDDAADAERANEVRQRFGMKCTWPRRLPIHHAISGAFRSSLFKNPALASAALSILSCPDLPSYIRRIHGNPRLSATFEYVSSEAVDFFADLHANRSSIPKGTPQQAEADRRVAVKVRKRVEDDACRLIAEGDIDWAGGESYPDEDEVRRVAREMFDDRDAIPLTKVTQQIAEYVSDGITKQTPTSGGFSNRYKSFGWDSRHALAAAVVDVFTCDRYASGAIGNFRTSRGMERQISARGGVSPADLLTELRRQCALPFGGA